MRVHGGSDFIGIGGSASGAAPRVDLEGGEKERREDGRKKSGVGPRRRLGTGTEGENLVQSISQSGGGGYGSYDIGNRNSSTLEIKRQLDRDRDQ